MYLHLTTNGSYNFKAPAIDADAEKKIEVVFPTQEQRDTTIDGSANVAVDRAVTVIDMTVEADATLTGVISDDVKIGDTVLIKATATGANRTLTLAANLGGKAIALTQNTEEDILLIFDGTNFVAIAAGADGADGADAELPAGNAGDIMYHNGTTWVTLAKGADGGVLTLAAGLPSWVGGS